MDATHARVDMFPQLQNWGIYFQLTHGRRLNNTRHDHEFYEIVVILEGGCDHTIDNATAHIEKGQVAFIEPGQYHRIENQLSGTNAASFSIRNDVMREFFRAYAVERIKPTVFIGIDTIERFSRQCESVDTIGHSEVRLRRLVGALLSELIRCSEERHAIPESIERIFRQMQQPELFREGMDAFVRISGFSYQHLSRLTHRYLGMTPGEYLTELRLRYAYDQIVYGSSDYESICEACGFSSFSHFYKLVRERFGKAPAKLRKQSISQLYTV